jgi:hypothetical protein
MSTFVHQPKNTIKGDTVWAYLSVDPDGTEGIVGVGSLLGSLALVTIDPKNLPRLEALAKEARRLTGKKIVLATFQRTSTKPL